MLHANVACRLALAWYVMGHDRSTKNRPLCKINITKVILTNTGCLQNTLIDVIYHMNSDSDDKRNTWGLFLINDKRKINRKSKNWHTSIKFTYDTKGYKTKTERCRYCNKKMNIGNEDNL